uniref:Hexosyltransferase n=1 Tax=Callorhinchus milii TaxID=7868 RepID=V9KHW6_CALMI
MRFSMLLSLVRPIGPIIIGISLGFTLSLLSVSWVEEPCSEPKGLGGIQVRKPNSMPAGPGAESEGNGQGFEPRIVPYKPANPASPPKKTIRSRYISTELGIRERLFVGVLTSKNTLNTLAVAVNRTLGQRVERAVYFTGTRSRKIPHGMYIVTHGDDRPIWNMYQTIKYAHDRHGNEYDWFYFVQDDVYTEGDRLRGLVGRLTIDTELYMGRPEEFIGGETEGRYCYGGFGYLLSRSLLNKLQAHLENCRNDILSARPDEWLGRCLIDYAGVTCVDEYEGVRYRYFELGKNTDPEREERLQFKNAFTVHPVLEPTQMYRLHKRFTEIELERTYQEIRHLQAEMKNLSGLTPGEEVREWPVGVNPPFRPRTRFEVLRWDYFTEEQLFSCLDASPKCRLCGVDRADVGSVIETAVEELNRRYQPVLHLRKQQLVNGYRRFDPTRGMEYTLDLRLEALTQRGHTRSITRRVQLLRPLSSVEIIPMPYVTEATRVNVILPLTAQDRPDAARFIDLFARSAAPEPGQNAVLTLLFVYDPLEAQQVHQNDVFADVKAKVGEFERKHPEAKIPWISVKTDAPSQIKIMDIVSKKHPVDTLFCVAEVGTQLSPEFLNRCRMNSINNWQVFFPIHFQEYSPLVAYHNQDLPPAPDLVKDAGHFDRHVFEEACFYNSDYMAARAKMASDALENEELLETMDVYDVFVKYSGLHVFRAVEPALRHRHRQRGCNPRLGEELYHRCVQSSLEALGSRSQLAMLLFEQEQGNST